MKKLSLLLLVCGLIIACKNDYLATLLKAPSELAALGVTAYVGDYQLAGGAAFEPGFSPSVREYVVYVPKEATGFSVDARFKGNGTVVCNSEAQDGGHGPESMDFVFAEDEVEKKIVLTVTRENMDSGEYRLSVVRDDGVDAPKDIQVHITPSIGSFFLNRDIFPELEVTTARPANGEITQSYQWYKNEDNNNRTGRQIPGATEARYRLSAKEASQKGTVYYYCAVTNSLNGRTTLVESGTQFVTFINKDEVLGVKSQSMTDIPAGTAGVSCSRISAISYYPAPWSTPGFKMGTYEVTYELWKLVFDAAEAGGYSFANTGNQGANRMSLFMQAPVGNKLHPVTMVSWRDCAVWCNAYSEMEGLQPVYVDADGNALRDSRETVEFETPNYYNKGYRLPTYAEWEYAARGAVPAPSTDLTAAWNYQHFGTDDDSLIPEYCWVDEFQTHEVGGDGLKPVKIAEDDNKVLYDMGGNVSEIVTLPYSEAAAVGYGFDYTLAWFSYYWNVLSPLSDIKYSRSGSLTSYMLLGFRIIRAKD